MLIFATFLVDAAADAFAILSPPAVLILRFRFDAA